MVKVAKKAKTRKQSRKDIKQPDQFVEVTSKSADWLTTYRTPLIGLVIAVFLIAIAVFSFIRFQVGQTELASSALEKALKVYSAEVTKNPPKVAAGQEAPKTFPTLNKKYEASIKAFETLLKKYQKTQSGRMALLYLGNSYLQLKKYTKAEDFYKKFIKGLAVTDPLYYLGVNGLAYVLEAKGKGKEGIALLKELKNNGPKSNKAFVLMRLAEYYDYKKDSKKARAYYKELAKDKSTYQTEAKKRLSVLP